MQLTDRLLESGVIVVHLGRSIRKSSPVEQFVWDIDKGLIQRGAFEGVDAIIHLAGANVGAHRWSNSWKREIMESRVRSSRLLFEHLTRGDHKVRKLVSASAIGYYGHGDSNTVFDEGDPPGSDFLATVVNAWEEEVEHVRTLGMPVVKLRLGVVLDKESGAIRKLVQTIRMQIGAVAGSGNQYLSWVHIDDVIGAFLFSLSHELDGPYNVVAPEPVTNRELTMKIARRLERKIWLPRIPAPVLRIVLGEMANYVVNGSRISGAKLASTGFEFQFGTIDQALGALLPLVSSREDFRHKQ